MSRFNEPDDLYAGLDDALSPRDKAALYNSEVLGAEMGIPSHVRDLVGDELFDVLPREGRSGRAEAISFAQNEAFNDYNPDGDYRNLASAKGGTSVYPEGEEHEPASSGLEEIPTATSMPDRPRTVAAAYDPERKVLTLVFRDGTYYNYYEVTMNEWQTFRGRASKWQYIRNVLDGKPRGAASAAGDDISADVRAAIYMVARTAQTRMRGKTPASQMRTAINKSSAPKSYPGRKPGVNPAQNAGKPPKRRGR